MVWDASWSCHPTCYYWPIYLLVEFYLAAALLERFVGMMAGRLAQTRTTAYARALRRRLERLAETELPPDAKDSMGVAYFYFVTPPMGLIELGSVSDRRIHARSVVVGVVLR
jgi:hypothetical protein